ncbi:MAG: YihY/virulence factor BrkB family protein [Cellulosilyticaceae bacterium]
MKRAIIFVQKLWKRYTRHDIAARSAQMTYYWVLAFFPFLIVIISLLSYTSIAETQFLDYLATVIPNSTIPFIEGTINQLIKYRSPTLLSFGAFASIWSASAGVNALTKGIHMAYNTQDLRPFWIRKIVAIIYTVLIAILIAFMIVLLIFGNKIWEYILGEIVTSQALYRPIWDVIRLTMPVLGLLVGIYIMYKFIPRKYVKNRSVWPGTLFTSFGWYGFSLLFSIYIDNFSKYNQMYGSIGGIFILLIWLYTSCMLLLVGSEINALCQDMRKGNRRVPL